MDNILDVLRHSLDILLIFLVIFFLLRFLKGSRAMAVLYGLLMLGVIYVIARLIDLQAFKDLIDRLAGVLLIVVVILFQPEIRRALARLGFQPIFQRLFQGEMDVTDEIVKAAYRLASKRTGALIVLTRQAGLKAITDQGHPMNAVVSADLIESVFNPYSPLHDGAIVVTNNQIVAARCLLPLSEKSYPSEIGTRHLAAIGITEESDAVVLIVSEERGKVSLAYHGELVRDLSAEQMSRQLPMLMAGVAGEED